MLYLENGKTNLGSLNPYTSPAKPFSKVHAAPGGLGAPANQNQQRIRRTVRDGTIIGTTLGFLKYPIDYVSSASHSYAPPVNLGLWGMWTLIGTVGGALAGYIVARAYNKYFAQQP